MTSPPIPMRHKQAALPTTSPSGAPLRPIDLVVIHCSATPSGQPLAQGQRGMPGYLGATEVINAWHAARGFSRRHPAAKLYQVRLPSIGYHWVIDLDGTITPGRHPCEVGAHAFNFNAHSLGICLVGGAERTAQYTREQWDSLAALVAHISTTYGVPLASPSRHYLGPQSYIESDGICGHRDLSPDKDGDGLVEPFEWLKTCPGFDVGHWLKNGLTPDLQNVYGQ